MAREAPNRALPEWLHLTEQDFEALHFSKLLLFALRRLREDFPNFSDLTSSLKLASHMKEFSQLWSLLSFQGIVSGSLDNCSLTLSGARSFDIILTQMPTLGERLMREQDGLEGEEASKLLLAIMQHHFENTGGPCGKA